MSARKPEPKAKRRNPLIPCKRCGHTRAQHVSHGALGTGRCKHCLCQAYSNGRQKNPRPLKLEQWIRLPKGAGAVRLSRRGRGRVLEYKTAPGKKR